MVQECNKRDELCPAVKRIKTALYCSAAIFEQAIPFKTE